MVPTPEELAAIRERLAHPDDYPGYGIEMAQDLLAEVDRLQNEAAAEAVSRKINSQSARALMDAIRDDPAFPPEEDPALFGERALLVINRLRAEVDRLTQDRERALAAEALLARIHQEIRYLKENTP
jgi:ribonucleotide reductase beta subunit family protein with ferritin-like domain